MVIGQSSQKQQNFTFSPIEWDDWKSQHLY